MSKAPESGRPRAAAASVDMDVDVGAALAIGAQELDALSSGDLDLAEQLARERGDLLTSLFDELAGQIVSGRHDADLGRSRVQPERLEEKINQLMAMQGALKDEAERLKSAIQEDLQRLRAENRRLSGYGQGTKHLSALSGGAFISKRG